MRVASVVRHTSNCCRLPLVLATGIVGNGFCHVALRSGSQSHACLVAWALFVFLLEEANNLLISSLLNGLRISLPSRLALWLILSQIVTPILPQIMGLVLLWGHQSVATQLLVLLWLWIHGDNWSQFVDVSRINNCLISIANIFWLVYFHVILVKKTFTELLRAIDLLVFELIVLLSWLVG